MGVGGQCHASAALLPGKRPVTILKGRIMEVYAIEGGEPDELEQTADI
jgi:hypothetical protein